MLLTLVIVAAMAAATGCASKSSEGVQPSYGVTSGPRFVIDLKPGPYYNGTGTSFLVFRYTVQPQVAVWVEKADGTYADTIFVTSKVESGKWSQAPETGRPEALPVWSHLQKARVDAVSSATPKGDTLYGSSLAANLPAGEYVIKLETNRSYDFNDSFAKKLGVNGQPSVVYEAELTIGAGRSEATFKPIGTGSADGSDGTVQPGLQGIDTALQLFDSMRVYYESE